MDVEKLDKKSVDIFGTTYTINIVDTLDKADDECNYYGETDHSSKIIKIGRNVHNIKQSDTEMKLTFLHELMHVILSIGQYNNCNNDEPLVEWLARCIYSLKNQNIL